MSFASRFGDSSVQRMKKYLSSKLPQLHDLQKNPCRVLDLGCGNGHLLFAILGSLSPDEEESSEEEAEDSTSQPKVSSSTALTKPEYCLGIDYSRLSIYLARNISEKRGKGCEKVRFEVSDLMKKEEVEKVREMSRIDGNGEMEDGWDLVCDKGTLDAVSNTKPRGRERESEDAD